MDVAHSSNSKSMDVVMIAALVPLRAGRVIPHWKASALGVSWPPMGEM
jgi:hypothetical protein